MRHAKLTACAAALLLSSPAAMAQEAQTRSFERVYVDVDGAAVLVPVELALAACALDEAGIQQAAASRLEESGFEAASVPDLFGDSGASEEAAESTAGTETLAADDPSGTEAPATDMAAADEAAGGEAAGGTEIRNVEPTAADTTDGGMTTNAQGSADATTTDPGERFLALAVCQVDLVRASELGIPTVANEIVTD